MKRLLILSLVLGACRTTPSPKVETDNPAPSTDVGEPQWLVWTHSEQGPRTYWVEAAPDGFRILGTSDGAWVGVADSTVAPVWEFELETTQATRTDCDCAYEAEQTGGDLASCDLTATLAVGVLRPFPTGPVIDLPSAAAVGPETQELFPTLDGTVGPFAFVTVCSDRYVCGAAHGDSSCEQTIYDLRTGAAVDAYQMAAEPLRGPEMLQFVREAYEDELEAEQLAEEDVTFTWVAPRYEKQAVPRMDEQYTGPACYACSDGLWDSYTISSRRTVDALPKPVTAWLERTPAPPAPFFAQLNQTIGGWSTVPPDATLRAKMDGVFVAE